MFVNEMTESLEHYDYSDIKPIDYVDGDHALAPIMYSEEYKYAASLLRATMQEHEYSVRALAIIERVLKYNAAHYSAWEYRYQILKHLGNSWLEKSSWFVTDIEDPEFTEDANFINRMTVDNPKNYQIWNYRKLLYIPGSKEYLAGEKLAAEVVLLDDEKNFHAWSHYKWVIKQDPTVERVSEGLEFSDRFIEKDVRNNSAWSFRYFIFELSGANSLTSGDGFSLEKDYVHSKISLAPENEAAWNYLVGIYEKFKTHADLVDCKDICIKYSESSTRALELLAEVYLLEKNIEASLKCYSTLEEKAPIRKGYWRYKKTQILSITEQEQEQKQKQKQL